MTVSAMRWLRRAQRWLDLPREYTVGGVRLKLPAEHLLPEYQAAHPLYDRFLPGLAAELQPGDAVVDVGANVGDTAAALFAGQAALQLLAIEADSGFFALLNHNAERLRRAHPQAVLHCQQVLVGQGEQRRLLVGGDGTRHAVQASETNAASAMSCVPLSTIVHAMPGDFAQRLRLVKSDVDGWDADVINSAMPLLLGAQGTPEAHRMQPLIYMECQVSDAASREAHLQCLRALLQAGYQDVHVFDNFGAWWLCTQRWQDVDACIDEVLAPATAATPRRAHYLDLLLATSADSALAQRVVARHRAVAAHG